MQPLHASQTALDAKIGDGWSGPRLGTVSGAATGWSIATKIKSDEDTLDAVRDSIRQSRATIETVARTYESILRSLNKMKSVLDLMGRPGADRDGLRAKVATASDELATALGSAAAADQGLLRPAGGLPANGQGFVASYDPSSRVVSRIELDLRPDLLLQLDRDIADMADEAGNRAPVAPTDGLPPGAPPAGDEHRSAALLRGIEIAIGRIAAAAARIGGYRALLESQEEFIGVLSSSLTAGVSAFVDADMNFVSTRLEALQSQQQLGIHSLSIANRNSEMILALLQ